METAAAAEQKKATVVKDFFSQCDKCRYWLRLRPLDGKYSTIPLRNCISEGNERWICQQCHDKIDTRIYEGVQ